MEFCLTCKICCRFPERNSPLIPFFLSKERGAPRYNRGDYQIGRGSYYGCRIDVIRHGEGYICPYFIPEKNCCSIYDTRPLDCRLYPYMITYDSSYKKVILVLDNKCPYSKEFVKPGEIDIIEQDIGLINDPQPDTVFVDELPRLTEFIFGIRHAGGRFRKLKIEDGHIIPYLWKDIMNVLYEEETGEVYYGVNGNFIRFSRDKEYIYLRKDLVELKGDRYKDKRNLCNYFWEKYSYKIERLSGEKIDECLNLYKKWAERKIKKGITPRGADGDYFQKLIEDSFFFHKRALMDFDKLGLEGIGIIVENRLVGYTFGFGKSKDTFYILAEITDQEYKGINQFIFREFCRVISDNYTYIDTMDDSGIEGLKRSKLSYHPIR